MHGARQTHLLKALLERLAASMDPNGHVIQSCAEACGYTIAGLTENVGTPDDVGIFRLQGGQQLVEAVANRSINFDIRFQRDALDVGMVCGDLAPAPSDRVALVINDRRRENTPEPAADGSNIIKVECTLDRPERKALQHFFGLFAVA